MASATSEYDVLQASFLGVVKGIHATAVARQEAIAAKDQVRVSALTDQINRNIEVANGYIARLREIEGPSSTLQFLDKAGDVVVQTAETIARYTGEAVSAVGGVAGKTIAGALLPWLIPVGLLLVALVYAAGKGGAVRLKGLT